MFPASSKGMGQCTATAPDVCKTPSPGGPVPVPYPNLSMDSQSVKFSTKVKFNMRPALNLMSEQPMSSGDEAGTAGGVVSGVNMNKVTYKKGSSKVVVEGKPAVFQSTMTGHNGMSANIPGLQASPSQPKVLVAS